MVISLLMCVEFCQAETHIIVNFVPPPLEITQVAYGLFTRKIDYDHTVRAEMAAQTVTRGRGILLLVAGCRLDLYT